MSTHPNSAAPSGAATPTVLRCDSDSPDFGLRAGDFIILNGANSVVLRKLTERDAEVLRIMAGGAE